MKIQSAKQFEILMTEVEAELRASQVPITARALKGVAAIAKRLDTEIIIGPLKTGPIPGNYEGESLSAHIFAWFDQRYGDRQKIDMSVGATIYVLDEDPWLVRLPLIMGKHRLVCEPDLSIDNPKIGGPGVIGNPEYPIVNIFKLIHDIPESKLKLLSLDDHKKFREFFVRALKVFQCLDQLGMEQSLARATQHDLTEAAKLCCGPKEDYSQSRWLSLQGAEKAIKLFISQRGEDFPFTHNLTKLLPQAVGLGLAGVSDEQIGKVQCRAEVRYGSIDIQLSEAVNAQTAAFSIAFNVVASLED